MQFANNDTVLHSRNGYEDHEDPAKWRHLFRLWLKVPGFRKFDQALIEHEPWSGWSRRKGILSKVRSAGFAVTQLRRARRNI